MKPILSALFILFITVPVFAQETSTPPNHWLQQVKTKYVCMVNDTVFEKPQIPVEVGNKTYYGCCMGCVSTLQNNKAIRYAIDPVTGNEVDKATAIIAADSERKAYYFENTKNLEHFKQLKSEILEPKKEL